MKSKFPAVIAILVVIGSLYAQPVKIDDVVQARVVLSHDRIRTAGEFRGVIVLDIKDGFHINSEDPSDPALIPTKAELLSTPGVTVSRWIYPDALVRTFQFSEKPLEVYEEKAVIGFIGKVGPPTKAGRSELAVKVRYQACNDDTCFRPTTVTVKVPVEFAAVTGKPLHRDLLSQVRWK